MPRLGGHTTKLIDAPSAHMRLDSKQHYEKEVAKWEQECKAIKKKDHRPPRPLPLYPHVKQYTPEALDVWLPHYETKGLGALIKREEFSALLRAMDALTELINGKYSTGKFARLLCVKVPLVGLNLRDEDETPEEEAALHEARKVLAKYTDRFQNHHHVFTSFQLKLAVATTAGLRPGI